MIADDITVASAIDAGNHVFTLVSMQGRTSIRQAADTASSIDHTLTIKHEDIIKGGQKVRRSLVRIDRKFVTDVSSTPYSPSAAYLVLEQPQLVSDTQMKANIEDLTDILATSGVIDKLLNGEP
jgi:hypothetical protein